MITADTITDEQIRALMREANIAAASCLTALSYSKVADPEVRARARARCAEILNARTPHPITATEEK